MTCADILTMATNLLAENGASTVTLSEFNDRAPYILAAFCGEARLIDKRYREAFMLGNQPAFDIAITAAQIIISGAAVEEIVAVVSVQCIVALTAVEGDTGGNTCRQFIIVVCTIEYPCLFEQFKSVPCCTVHEMDFLDGEYRGYAGIGVARQ